MVIERNIDVFFPTNTDGSLTHQVRNLGEDFWRLIELEKLGDVGGFQAIDSATDRLVIRVFHARKVRIVRKMVASILKNHLLDSRSQVTYY